MSSDKKTEDAPPPLTEEEPKSQDASEKPEENPVDSSEEEKEDDFIYNLAILPPLRKGADTNDKVELTAMHLPPLRATEPVSSIRAALGEVRAYAHCTNYRLVLDTDTTTRNWACTSSSSLSTLNNTSHSSGNVDKSEGANSSSATNANKRKKNKKNKGKGKKQNARGFTEQMDVVSPHTGADAVISIPHGILSLENDPSLQNKEELQETASQSIVLDDYGDLTSLPDLKSGMAFRMVLERYDMGSVRDHINRLRGLLDGNAPGSEIIYEEEPAVDGEKGVNVSTDQNEPSPDGTKTSNDDKSVKLTPDSASEVEKTEDKLKNNGEGKTESSSDTTKPGVFPLERPAAIDGTNLEDHYHLACGEEDAAAHLHGDKTDINKDIDEVDDYSSKLNELDARCKVNCLISYSNYHPPPSHRRMFGDIAYLEVNVPGSSENVIHITAIPSGFYVNRSVTDKITGEGLFDPTPSYEPCYSHALLDCLLQKSKCIRESWSGALAASKERAEVSATAALEDSPFKALYRAATRGDYENDICLTGEQIADSVTLRPSWIVPVPRSTSEINTTYKNINPSKSSQFGYQLIGNHLHKPDTGRMEEDIGSTFGMDLRGGAARDWNEELQTARELPVGSQQERIERARLIHKTLSDFGDAAVAGARAIFEGLITPMNPNEPTRSHVYLHNNIFFSRAVDAGVDTFKIARGDAAARKSAIRDASCVGILHQLDIPDLYTLATVLVDYLGTRLVCQSIVPGILQGDKTHEILYGAVEATSPLFWNGDLHGILEKHLGNSLMVATREMPKYPLNEEKMKFIESMKRHEVRSAYDDKDKKSDTLESSNSTNKVADLDYQSTVQVCGPLEMKGIRGSDKRIYCLDLTRLTPRDANWVPKSMGGTGYWESVRLNADLGDKRITKLVPESLDSDEFITAVLRPELITAVTHSKMRSWIEGRKKTTGKTSSSEEKQDKQDTKDSSCVVESNEKSEKLTKITHDNILNDGNEILKEESEEYLKSLRLNLNVFLPNLRSSNKKEVVNQIAADEEVIRSASSYLWNEVLPSITSEVRSNSNHHAPVDGRALTDFLHQRGVNCRYMGRLASLAREEEAKDEKSENEIAKSSSKKKLERRIMPLYWLELLECEMVARAAKHVLDRYLTQNGGAAASQPARTISSFLSSIMSSAEESAAETEVRLMKENCDKSVTLDEDISSLSLCDVGRNGDAATPPLRGRKEVWKDIEDEVGVRFRYVLSLYNKSKETEKSSRALLMPLLRRVCQRSGIRLAGKNYKIGSKGLCSTGPHATIATFPISPVDILDILPMIRHAGASSNDGGFVPCNPAPSAGASSVVPHLHILLPDAKAAYEAAQVHLHGRSMHQALELVQDATSLYQRVVDTALHVRVSKCLDLTAVILFQARELELASANAGRALAVAVQIGGFDCHEAVSAHTTLSHILLNSNNLKSGVKHLRASMYLMELLSGPRYVELSNLYHKLGTVYHEIGNVINALRFYQEASTRKNQDRVVEGMLAKTSANILAALGQYKAAFETEKRSFSIFRWTLGEENDLTKASAKTLKVSSKHNGAFLVREFAHDLSLLSITAISSNHHFNYV